MFYRLLYRLSLYVDDLQISCEGFDMRMIERQLQTAVHNIVKWCDSNGHSISASKSCCVHFCRKRGIHPYPEIRICDIQIRQFPTYDSWSTFDRFLAHFHSGIFYNCGRGVKSLFKPLGRCCQTPLGDGSNITLECIEAIVLSRIDYGCVVYGSACNSTLKNLTPSTIWH
ncbi:putative RNA-directed DNA polymerase from transposon BS [Trichonephila clavipes]|nr:putative RNA-directed DNA polymerase from transposon BS [Trichonephila clavipes]